MASRVTDRYVADVFIDQIFAQRDQLEKARNQISTGLEVINPSDDPGRSGIVSQLQNTAQRLKKHQDRISAGQEVLGNQESILDTTQNLMVRAKELAAQAANGSMSAESRSSIGDEVFQLRDELVSLANSTYQGRYIWGGAADDTAPFSIATPSPGYTNPSIPPATSGDPETERYVFSNADGATLTRSIQITDGETLRINTSGNDVFTNAIGSLEQLGRALKGYRTTLDSDDLPDGGGTAYSLPADRDEQTANILNAMEAINSAIVDDISTERSDVGARINRLEQANEILDQMVINTESTRSTFQDADPFEAISNISNLETGLQALLTSGVRITSLSLLNFL